MNRLAICEVGPRDGLQNAAGTLPIATRAELIDRLAACGLPRIEAVSFVHPGRVPAMAGAEEVLGAVHRDADTRLAGLVLNERGYERFVDTDLDEVRFTFAVSETFNRRNSNTSTTAGLIAARNVIHAARAAGVRAVVVLATAFGCPFEGEVDAGVVIEFAADLALAGVDEIIFADTIGVAAPRQVRALVTPALGMGPAIGVHMHNTRNTGYVTTFAAVEAGVDVIDASIGGLGGCPFAPAASGNIATEDIVYALEREGVETGVDLDRLLQTAEWLSGVVDASLEGQLRRAGRFPPPAAAH
ncbi:MAG: pyruvate carboxyltransferase [Solirubrobacterales bacterium]|jgi:hydroxymethylglutaryl-CoA lyase/(R)-citramalyl-CoA lyase|nr:pyruvate carboxyltransferase [Solirubrobacterales bacterium]